MDEMNEMELDFKRKGTHTFRVTAPLLFWEEFEMDAKENFNNTYYLKMMMDHEFRKNFQSVCGLLMQDISELRERITELQSEVQALRETPKEEKRKTFGGK